MVAMAERRRSKTHPTTREEIERGGREESGEELTAGSTEGLLGAWEVWFVEIGGGGPPESGTNGDEGDGHQGCWTDTFG